MPKTNPDRIQAQIHMKALQEAYPSLTWKLRRSGRNMPDIRGEFKHSDKYKCCTVTVTPDWYVKDRASVQVSIGFVSTYHRGSTRKGGPLPLVRKAIQDMDRRLDSAASAWMALGLGKK